MFCPSCGTEYTIELKYCNRCGANLSAAIEAQTEPVVVNLTRPALIIGTMLAVFTLGGFGALIGGALSLAPVIHGNDPLIAIIFFGMIVILTDDVFLVRQLSKIINAALSSTSQVQSKQPKAVTSRPAAQLQQPMPARLQQAPSVTENTTRFFEPDYRAPSETKERATTQDIKT